MTDERNAGRSANERFKHGARRRLTLALAAAVLIHGVAFALGGLEVLVPGGEPVPGPVKLVDAVELALPAPPPPAPPPVTLPAVPTVASLDDLLPDEIDLPVPDFDRLPDIVLRIPEPSAARSTDAFAEYQKWVPSMVKPELLNRDEVARELQNRYPPGLLRAGVDGVVVVMLWIDEAGEVQKHQVTVSSGHPGLDRAAELVVERMEFRPALQMGGPTKVMVSLPITFRAG